MRVRAQATLPKGRGWAFEPKWDGFRAIAWSGGRLDSRRKRPLLPYFPELAPKNTWCLIPRGKLKRDTKYTVVAASAEPAETKTWRFETE